MKVAKIMLGLLMLVVMFGVSFGFNYVTGCNKTPEILVWGEWTDNNNITIQVIDLNGNVVFNGAPTILSDYSNSLGSGIYYSEIHLKESGHYIVVVNKDGSSESKEVSVSCINNGLTGKFLSASSNPSETTVYFNIINTGLTFGKADLTVYYRGGSVEKQVLFHMGDNLVSFKLPSLYHKNSLVVLHYPANYVFTVLKWNGNTDNGNAKVYADKLYIHRGQTVNYTFSIENLENYTITYSLSYNSNLNIVGPKEVTVGPNETQKVTLTVSADRYFNETPYFDIVVNSNKYPVDVILMGAIGFKAESNLPDTVLTNTKISGTVTVTNIGDLAEKVDFSYKVNGVVYNYPYELTLKPGESFSYPVTFMAKDNDIDFVAYVNGNQIYEKTIAVNPIIKQFYAVLDSNSFKLFKGGTKSTILTIQNTGNVKDTFTIIPSDDVSVNKTKVTLGPNEMAQVKVTVLGANYGNQTLSLKVCDGSCETYNIYLFVDMPVEQRATVLLDNSTTFIPNETLNYTLTIENNYPLGPQTYTVYVNGNVSNIFTINASSTKEVVIPLTFNESKNYTVNFEVTSAEGYKFDKNVTFVPQKENIPTGEFILGIGSPSWWALVTLAVIGTGFLGYYIYLRLGNKVKTEKTVVSNEFR